MQITWRINMEIKEIPTDKIDLNPWNPNEMTDGQLQHLIEEYNRIGYLQPILVRPKGDRYEVIDGEHRFRAYKSLVRPTIQAVVKEMDDKTAKLTTININKIKGADNPLKQAELLKDLQKDFSTEDLEDLLKISELELEGFDMLLNLPEDIATEDIAEAKPKIVFEFESVEERNRIWSLVVSNQFDWKKTNKPNTYLLIKAIDEWCLNNA